MSKDLVRQAFLKQITRWQDDENIRPADLFAKSVTRRQFSEKILGRSVEAVKSYWQQRVFSGRDIPPPEFATEDAVVEYVKQHPGAIGYVSKGVDLSTTKVVSVR
jgi:ABC-type phosphate transport system substrate-binding protein